MWFLENRDSDLRSVVFGRFYSAKVNLSALFGAVLTFTVSDQQNYTQILMVCNEIRSAENISHDRISVFFLLRGSISFQTKNLTVNTKLPRFLIVQVL